MRAFVIGSKTLSCVILDALLEQGHEVLGVYARDDEPGMQTWHDLGHRNLAKEAEEKGIPVHLGIKVNSAASLDLLQSLDLDLILSCFWSEIFKEPILNLPKLGVYNFHTAKLPKNRGSRPLPWAMIKGEEEAGMTVHRMMTGVDNGPIVAQRSFPIEADDTGRSIYDKAHKAGSVLAKEVIELFARHTHRLILQDEEQATYQPRGEPYGRMIDPYWSDERKDRFARAFNFPPFAGALEAPNPLNGSAQIYILLNTECRSSNDVTALNELSVQDKPITCFGAPSIEPIRLPSFDWHALGPESEHLQIPLEKTPSSRVVMQALKTVLSGFDQRIGLRPDQCSPEGIHKAYRPLDLLLRKKAAFVSSRIIPLNNNSNDLVAVQPHYHINGVLELPSLEIDQSDPDWEGQMRECMEQAKTLLSTYKRDVFIGWKLSANALNGFLHNRSVNEVFELNNVGFSTYREVCGHYHSIYSNS
jgi:methionyl-tRNA formyltransferase